MNLRTLSRQWITLIVYLFATACVTNHAPAPISSSPIASMTPINTTLPTLKRTATSTPTILPPTQIPTLTPTPAPTLTSDQATTFVEAMLETNGGCDLPCWWGGKIIPGKTRFEDSVRYFESQGIPLSNDGAIVGFDIPSHKVPHYNTVWIAIGQQEDTVSSIKIDGIINGSLTYNSDISPRFTSSWQHYSWSRVFKSLDQPTQIRINLSASNYSTPASYRFVMFYETLGMAIEYGGLAQDITNSRVRVCPKFNEVTEIHITLISPTNGDVLLNAALPPDPLLEKYNGVHVIDFWPLIEDETGMSVATFFLTYKNANSTICLEGFSGKY